MTPSPSPEPLWIFGYGSLVWRPSLPWSERRPGWIAGWERRFWQCSVDHRGLPGSPGRVATLVPMAEGRCWGVAWRVTAGRERDVLAGLDHRERGGYQRVVADVRDGGGAAFARALLYVAGPENRNWCGPAPLDQIAATIDRARGPSGPNDEYLLRLAESLREIGAEDAHVFGIESELLALRDGREQPVRN